MGYRSDVRIMTTKKGYNKLRKYTDEYLKSKNYKYGNLMDDLDLNEETKYAKYIGWNDIKWYEGDDDIDSIMSGLDYLEENNYSYRYARIGENYFESDKEEEQDLEYPSMTRYFEDEWIVNQMKLNAGEIEKEI